MKDFPAGRLNFKTTASFLPELQEVKKNTDPTKKLSNVYRDIK